MSLSADRRAKEAKPPTDEELKNVEERLIANKRWAVRQVITDGNPDRKTAQEAWDTAVGLIKTLHEDRGDQMYPLDQPAIAKRLKDMPKLTSEQAGLIRQRLINGEHSMDAQRLDRFITNVKRFMTPEDSAMIRHRILDPWGREVSEEEWQMNFDAQAEYVEEWELNHPGEEYGDHERQW